MEGQLRLKNAKVLCIGAGGLGSPAMMYLAAAGVGRVTVVDDDVVDASNLQRQIVHDSALVGSPKTESARASVQRINPLVEFVGLRERLTDFHRAVALFAEHDVVVDGSDNFPTKFLANDACVAAGVPSVYAAILRFEGQASVFNYPPHQGATYRDFLAEAPPPGTVPSCAEGGVLGVLCGVLGAIQATEAIKIILGKPPPETLANRLLVYNARHMTFRELPLLPQPAPRPPVSDDDDDDATTDDDAAEASRKKDFYDRTIAVVDAATAAARLADGWDPFVLDVRLPQEAEICSLPFVDALCPHRRLKVVPDLFRDQIPSDRDLLVHCKSGFRSNLACQALADLGYTRLFNLKGGILAWADQVDPRLPKY